MGEEYENELSHERRRRGIFVENQTQEILAPSGATSSGRICRPAGAGNEMDFHFFKYVAPTALDRQAETAA